MDTLILRVREIIRSLKIVSASLKVDFTEGHRDGSLFHIANCLVKGGMTPANAEKTMLLLGQNCSPAFPENECFTKIKSALDRARRKERNVSGEVREWVQVSTGLFLVSEMLRESQLVSKEERHAAILELGRLLEQGIIERVGPRRGSYRLVERECEDIDFLNASGGEYPVVWPLGIETLFKAMPGNIMVVAGEPDAGKTAFLLNLVKLNMERYRIQYFSSEMGPQELRERLKLFPNTTLEQWRFDPKERADKFEDVVNPDGFNVIDFVEIHDQFYLIGATLKAIHDKLKGGIAVIAIQKDRNAPLGRGGSFSLEKPRLCLTMSANYPGGIIRIEKCKNWRTSENPNKLERCFRLYQGCSFVAAGEWCRPQSLLGGPGPEPPGGEVGVGMRKGT